MNKGLRCLRRVRFYFAFLAIGLVCVGCSYYNLSKFNRPSVSFVSLDLKDFKQNILYALLTLNITNDSVFSYPEFDLIFSMTVEGLTVAETVVFPVQPLAAVSSVEVEIPISIDFGLLRDNTDKIFADNLVEYKIDGMAMLLGWESAFQFEKEIALPKITLKNVDFAATERNAVILTFANRNPTTSIPLKGLKMEVYFQEQLLAALIGGKDIVLPANQSTDIEFIFSYDVIYWRSFVSTWLMVDALDAYKLDMRIIFFLGEKEIFSTKSRLSFSQEEKKVWNRFTIDFLY